MFSFLTWKKKKKKKQTLIFTNIPEKWKIKVVINSDVIESNSNYMISVAWKNYERYASQMIDKFLSISTNFLQKNYINGSIYILCSSAMSNGRRA